MASPLFSLFFLFLSLFPLSSPAQAQRPKALVLLVAKDAATLQYVARLHQRTPLVPLTAVVHLGGAFLEVDCGLEFKFNSTTYRRLRCGSAQCNDAARSRACTFVAHTCSVTPENPFTRTISNGFLGDDVLSLSSTDGSNPGRPAAAPHVAFACVPTTLLEGLAGGAGGIAGLGRNLVGMPSQLAAAFSFRRMFALCLTYPGVGVVFFGNGPYVLLPGIDVSQQLIYTPLLVNPVSTAGDWFEGMPSFDYFVGVTSIRVNTKPVAVNRTLLAIDKKTGYGGTKISTAEPYSVLETSIYRAVTGAFARESGVRMVAPVKPFGFCFDSKGIGSTRVGPAVPQIDLVMQSQDVYWRIFGANSVVQVKEGVMCLAFVDGGVNPMTSIVVGGYQLEDNLLEFDLAASKLGFSSSLLFRRTTCANFNFTSIA